MKSLLPIISSNGGVRFTAILVNAEQINRNFGRDKTLQVAKTSIPVQPGDEWDIILIEHNQCVSLLSSSDAKIRQASNIDLVDFLGHYVSLAPWQLLCLQSSVDRGQYVTYLADE